MQKAAEILLKEAKRKFKKKVKRGTLTEVEEKEFSDYIVNQGIKNKKQEREQKYEEDNNNLIKELKKHGK